MSEALKMGIGLHSAGWKAQEGWMGSMGSPRKTLVVWCQVRGGKHYRDGSYDVEEEFRLLYSGSGAVGWVFEHMTAGEVVMRYWSTLYLN